VGNHHGRCKSGGKGSRKGEKRGWETVRDEDKCEGQGFLKVALEWE
jgi:hypothetical protein